MHIGRVEDFLVWDLELLYLETRLKILGEAELSYRIWC